MKLADIERAHLGGVQKIWMFDNGWGASVVRFQGSYGFSRGLWELAVLKFNIGDINDSSLNYDHSVSCGDVRGSLTETEVEELLEEIAATNENTLMLE
jgi:hypothetical protein